MEEILTTNNTYIFDIDEADTNFSQTLQIVYKVRHAVNATGGTAKMENYLFASRRH